MTEGEDVRDEGEVVHAVSRSGGESAWRMNGQTSEDERLEGEVVGGVDADRCRGQGPDGKGARLKWVHCEVEGGSARRRGQARAGDGP